MKESNCNSKSSDFFSTGNSAFASNDTQVSEMNKIFSYSGNNVTMRVINGIVFVNLTEFAKPFPDKNLSQIINSKEITSYVTRLSEIRNYSSLDLLQVRRGNYADGAEQGTWAHQKIAIRVAQKLSTDFAIWVDDRIEELLTTGVTTVSNDDEAIAYAMQVLNKRLEASRAEQERLQAENQLQSRQLQESAPKIKCYNDYISSDGTFTATQIAKEYGWGAETLNKKLKEMGIQYKQNGQWLLTAKYDGNGYTKSVPRTYTKSDGTTGTQMQTVWTSKGREFIHSLFKDA